MSVSRELIEFLKEQGIGGIAMEELLDLKRGLPFQLEVAENGLWVWKSSHKEPHLSEQARRDLPEGIRSRLIYVQWSD